MKMFLFFSYLFDCAALENISISMRKLKPCPFGQWPSLSIGLHCPSPVRETVVIWNSITDCTKGKDLPMIIKNL